MDLTKGILPLRKSKSEITCCLVPIILQARDVQSFRALTGTMQGMQLWDGWRSQFAIVSSKLSHLVDSGMLRNGIFFELKDYFCHFQTGVPEVTDIKILVSDEASSSSSTTSHYESEACCSPLMTPRNGGQSSTALSFAEAVTGNRNHSMGGDARFGASCSASYARAITEPSAAAIGNPTSPFASLRLNASGFTAGSEGVCLSSGYLWAIANGSLNLKGVVQVVKCFPNFNASEKLVLSDGLFSIQATLVTPQMNRLARSGRIQKGTVVQLVQYACVRELTKRTINVMDMQILREYAALKGEPVELTEDMILKVYEANKPIFNPRYPLAKYACGYVPSILCGYCDDPFVCSHCTSPIYSPMPSYASLPPYTPFPPYNVSAIGEDMEPSLCAVWQDIDNLKTELIYLQGQHKREMECLEFELSKEIVGLEFDMKEKMVDLEDKLKEKMVDLEDKVKEKMVDLEDKVKEKTVDLEDKVKEKMVDLEDKVKEKMVDLEDKVLILHKEFDDKLWV